MRLTDLTNKKNRCNFDASCPAVYLDAETGNLIIVGAEVIPDGTAGRIGLGEAAVEIDPDLVAKSIGGPISRLLIKLGL